MLQHHGQYVYVVEVCCTTFYTSQKTSRSYFLRIPTHCNMDCNIIVPVIFCFLANIYITSFPWITTLRSQRLFRSRMLQRHKSAAGLSSRRCNSGQLPLTHLSKATTIPVTFLLSYDFRTSNGSNCVVPLREIY